MSWWKIRGNAQRAEVSIYGDIGESWWGESVTAKDCCAAIAKIDASAIDVRINSYGGAVADGLAIYNALRRHPATITTHNDGVAMSIASLIFMAGTERYSADNALFMIHAPWGMAAGNAADMRDMADILDKYAEGMVSAYRSSGLSDDEIRALLTDGQDHFYTAAEAQAAGFVTHVTEALPIAAQYILNRFTRRLPHNTGVTPMAESGNTPAAPETPAAVVTPPVETPNIAAIEAAAEARALARIRERNAEFDRQIAPLARNVPSMSALIDELRGDVSISVEAAGQRILAKMAEGCEPLMQARVEVGCSAEQKFGEAAVSAIRARAGLDKFDGANPLNGHSLMEMGRASIEMRGVKTHGMSREDIARAILRPSNRINRAYAKQTTSDFDTILENIMHKELLSAYQVWPALWDKICITGSVSDLREWNRYKPGSIGNIEDVNEAGEYRFKNIPDAVKEKISAKRRGNRIAVTPEVIINDDIGFFSRVPADFGRAAKRTIDAKFVELLISASKAGPTLNETGAALFSTTHNNLVTTGGSAPSVAAFSAGRVAMMSQKDPSGNEFLMITPSIWLGPPSLSDTARVVNGSIYDPDTANKLQRNNPVYGMVQTVLDHPQLSGTDWYLFASPSIAPTFEVVFLDGQSEPRMSMDEDFATSGLAWKVELAFGVGVVDYRGAYRNDGA